MKTWIAEIAVVWVVLIGVVALTRGGPLEAVGALAVLATFAHAQVAERMREKEALKAKPDVHCHRWSLRYFVAKELLWLSYFVAHRSWSALVGVGVFLAYPLWRKWWRARHPLLKVYVDGPVVAAFINARKFDLLQGSSMQEGADKEWRALLVMRLDRFECEFLAARSRANVPMQVVLQQLNGRLVAGDARPKGLRFLDRPDSPGVRFAQFALAGETELTRV